MNKLEFTNKVIDNLNDSIHEDGKVGLAKFIELTNKLYEAIDCTHSCTELPNKAVKDSQLSDMVEGYKIMCKPDTNFEKYYSKGFTECWEWLKRITK